MSDCLSVTLADGVFVKFLRENWRTNFDGPFLIASIHTNSRRIIMQIGYKCDLLIPSQSTSEDHFMTHYVDAHPLIYDQTVIRVGSHRHRASSIV